MKIRVKGSLVGRLPRFLNAIQLSTLLAGAVLTGWTALTFVDSAYAQWAGERSLRTQIAMAKEQVVTPRLAPKVKDPGPPKGSVIGRLEIPRLKLGYVVLEGTDDRTLGRSIGHVEGTALPGGNGNIGIAGHRNTHFRKLEWIRRGDRIVVTSPAGESRYAVEWARVFGDHDSEVLDPDHGPALTLITCFPFEYVGSAPMRFIVRALPETGESPKP